MFFSVESISRREREKGDRKRERETMSNLNIMEYHVLRFHRYIIIVYTTQSTLCAKCPLEDGLEDSGKKVNVIVDPKI